MIAALLFFLGWQIGIFYAVAESRKPVCLRAFSKTCFLSSFNRFNLLERKTENNEKALAFLNTAGCFDHKGYSVIQTSICGKHFSVKQHNLLWFIVYGRLPKEGFSIDHKNDRKADNRLENLRLLSNAGQSIARQRGSYLPPWVYLDKRNNKFYSRIRVLKKRKNLGYFHDSWKAHTTAANFAIENGLISAEEYELLIREWKEFRGGKNG